MAATRHGLRLSPDSITYLAVADHLRSGRGFTDFTGEQLTVVGPIQPLLLAAGGADVMWARMMQSAGSAASAVLMFVLLRRAVRLWMAVAGAMLRAADNA